MSCKHVLTILAVKDLPKAVKFYSQAFGWAQTVNVPVYTEFELPGGYEVGAI